VHEVHPAFTLVLAVAVGVLAQSAARHLRVPGIVLLLAAGVGLGPDGLGWVRPSDLGEGLFAIVHLAVAVVLFEGGLNLEISRLRRAQAPIQRLVTVGAAVTTVGGALAAHAVFGWSVVQCLLFGTLVVVTGPTVVGPLIDQLRLRPRVATVLEAEGILIDPVGAILAVLMLEVALAPVDAESLAEGARLLLLRLGFGTALGATAGLALAGVLRVRRVVPEGHENILVLAAVLLLFQGSEEVVPVSGIAAVVVAGVVVGNLNTRADRDLREFKDQLTVLLIGMLFVLLAADVRLEEVRALGWHGAAVVGALLFAVRPIGVWLCTRGSDMTAAERWFVAWIAPRGIVAAAVASVTANALNAADLPGGTELRALVFLTIATTVVLAGLTAAPLGSLLGVRLPGRETIAILGAEGLGLLLGRALRDGGVPVIFLDSNPRNCREAEEAGFPVIFGNAMQERTMRRARFGGVGAAVGVTQNQVLNTVFTARASEYFRVPERYIAVTNPSEGLAMETVEKGDAHVLFDGRHDVERWDVRRRHGEVDLEPWVFQGPPEGAKEKAAPAPGEQWVALTLERGGRVRPAHQAVAWKASDVATVAIYAPEREEAHRILRARGFVPAPAAESEPGSAPEPT
jgi:NhaP-type Na+/H+ or K+/H+ antiporter